MRNRDIILIGFQECTAFLEQLGRVGDWPCTPRILAVANGRGDGTGIAVPPGETVLTVDRIYPGTAFHAQAQGKDVTVAELKRRFPAAEKTITTSGFPELDGAPGGTRRSVSCRGTGHLAAGPAAGLETSRPLRCRTPAPSGTARTAP
ncbi:hypothetical protein [Streptomyces sp. NPDC003688]